MTHRDVGRFAPSTTGPAHPGTLMAALLCWLDARSRGARVWLRLEDLDPDRSRPETVQAMHSDLAWLGLDWDGEQRQHELRADHAAALDRLEAAGRLYPCRCSRTDLRLRGELAPDGGARYPGTCRDTPLPAGGWRQSDAPLRARLEPGFIALRDESGLALDADPEAAFGDPVVRRRDGVAAYHLASVVDDASIGVTRVVRGRDLATSTATQAALQGLLGLPRPAYRHHLLLLEERGDKLAKLHGAVGAAALRAHYAPAELCGWLAMAAGLVEAPDPVTPRALLPSFDWQHVGTRDRIVRFSGQSLELVPLDAGR